MQLISFLVALMALLMALFIGNVVSAPAADGLAAAEPQSNSCLPHWLFNYENECELGTVDGYDQCVGACLAQPGPHCGDCMGAILYDGGPSCCQCTC
ncbi:hypothetical protein K490DRAFT_66265 [Saccharata proteae CBS 121410]|uniref:Uncharacterized protein n=1 Tax=Saccharata proteae CBS 121410 TaxID=1314787 RepID=A0A9P4LZI2_9PEZI|nr:hypothetical protein K490DRAFT_66265 [Saccharata proteae CBS 121410]